MKSKFFYLSCMLGCILLGFITGGSRALAVETHLSVEPVIPQNQLTEKVSYFHIQVLPGGTEELHVTLKNTASKEITVVAEVAGATTNDNGVVEYGPNEIQADASLKFDLADLVEYPNEIQVAANASADFVLRVKVPVESFNGIVAGGLTFYEKAGEENNQTTNEEGVTFKNKINYVIAVLLQENSDKITPDLKLKRVKATQVNQKNVIQANLQNPQPLLISGLKSSVKVTKVGSEKVLYSQETSGMQMAPNSNFNYTLNLPDNTAFAAGKYLWDQEILISTGGTWHFKQEFEITNQVAKELNAADLTVVQTTSPWLYGLLALCLLLVILIVVMLIRNNRLKKRIREEVEAGKTDEEK